MFGHEKFKAYQHAINFVALATTLIESLNKGNAHLVDQLRRASISIPLNIAEGSGKITERDKVKYYAIARGSTMECAAILDILQKTGAVELAQIEKPKRILSEVAGILSKVCLNSK